MNNQKKYLKPDIYRKELSKFINDDDKVKRKVEKLNKTSNNKGVILNQRVYRYNEDKPVSKTLRTALFKSKYEKKKLTPQERYQENKAKKLRDKEIKEREEKSKTLQEKLREIQEFNFESITSNFYRSVIEPETITLTERGAIQSKYGYTLDNVLKIDGIKQLGVGGLDTLHYDSVKKKIMDVMKKTKSHQKLIVRGTGIYFNLLSLGLFKDSIDVNKILEILETKGIKKYQNAEIKKLINIMHNYYINPDASVGEDGISSFEKKSFYTTPFIIKNKKEINQALVEAHGYLDNQFENALNSSSGLILVKIESIDIHLGVYDPLRGSKYLELPEQISNKKATINIKNDDDYCFKYSVLCHTEKIYMKPHPERVSYYKTLQHNINFEGVNFPASFDDIDTFENINNNIYGVNVYGFKVKHQEEFKDEVVDMYSIECLRTTKLRVEDDYLICLLLIEEEHEDITYTHYVYIKNLDRLLSSQYSKVKHKMKICRYCHHGYSSIERFEKSPCKIFKCVDIDNTILKMPSEGQVVKFMDKDMSKRFECPFAIMLDFEAFNVKFRGCNNNNDKTSKLTNHQVCSYGLKVVSPYEDYNENLIFGDGDELQDLFKPRLYKGDDSTEHLFNTLKEIENKIMILLRRNEPIRMTQQQKQEYECCNTCHICKKQGFSKKGDEDYNTNKKVADHDHLTGLFRGAAHHNCNVRLNHRDFKIPVFTHNFKGYDSHFIISKAHEFKCKNINCIVNNSEKFMSLSFDRFEFKDSYPFMSSSIDKVVKLNKYDEVGKDDYVKRDNWMNNFKYTSRYAPQWLKENLGFDEWDNDCLDKLTEKGVLCYSYLDGYSRFNEPLPSKEMFHDNLTEQDISDKDYKRAEVVYNRFKCKNLGDYHDLYLLTDILLLCDTFMNFRKLCLDNYDLDCFQFLTLSHYAWVAMLKLTNVKLELIHDLEMYDMVESAKRGGMTQVSHRYIKANNKYLDDFDESKPSNYLQYIDANNLYGLAMSMKLPLDGYKWKDDLTLDDIINYENGDKGYFVKVDLEYPDDLHDLHSDYPLAPEKLAVKAEWLSEYQQQVYRKENNLKTKQKIKDEKTEKLILNLNDKDNYVCHIRILQLYIQLGLKVKKIHRAVEFNQSEWLNPWIEFNTKKRTESKDDFSKNLYKLMNNAVFGKTMEDVKNRVCFELVDNEHKFKKLLADPRYKNSHQINENLVGIERTKKQVYLNKPIAIGVAILDLSKMHMYNFFYNVLKKRYGENVRLLYTDTDSFIINVNTEDLYQDLLEPELNVHYDFSGYDKNHPLYSNKNKKVLGKFKDELDGNIMSESLNLAPKMYGYKYSHETKITVKGVPKRIVKTLMFDELMNTLLNAETKSVEFNTIRSKNHELYNFRIRKTGIRSFENKRYYLDNINSVPYGHYKTRK